MGKRDDQDFWTLMSDPGELFAGVKKVLILAPHPDDETLGCGGLIALYVSKGVDVTIAVISDGGKISHEFAAENIDIVETRERESLEAARLLGVKTTFFLKFPDGELKFRQSEIEMRVEELVRTCGPDIIFSPSPLDFHEDHIAVSEVAFKLLIKFHEKKVAFYEVYGTIRFNSLVDISDFIDLKERAILCYDYSLFRRPEIFAAASKGIGKFRSFYTQQDRFYEAFLILSDFREKSDLFQWLTYGSGDPASLFLAKLKIVDELLFEVSKYHDVLHSREADIRELRILLAARQKGLEELQTAIDKMTGSLVWRIAVKFYNFRDILLPEGSIRRRVYERMTGRLKTGRKGLPG